MIDGNVYELAGWVKQGNTGAFLSLRAKLKEGDKPKPRESAGEEEGEALPF